MILVYVCFIVELFLRLHTYTDVEGRDPLLTKQWMLTDIQNDLILLENQLPFFVLEQFYNLTTMNLLLPPFLRFVSTILRILKLEPFVQDTLHRSFKIYLISSSNLHVGTPNE